MVSLSSSSSSSHSSSSSGRHHPSQRFGGPGFHEPMLPPPDLQSAAPHGHLAQSNHSPPPPLHRQYGHHPSHQFGRPAFHESMLSTSLAHESAVPHQFMSRNHSPPLPPPSLGHHRPPPPSHGHPQQFGGSAFHEPMFASHPALEGAAPNMLMNRNQSPPHLDYHSYSHSPPSPPHHHGHGHHRPHQLGRSSALEIEEPHVGMENSLRPPAHLDYRKYLHSPPSPPHRHGHGQGHLHPHQLGRRSPALETEESHLFAEHLYRSHPPPPQGHQSQSSPFYGFQHHAAKFHMQPPMEPSEETLHQYEPNMSGMGPHGMSDWLPREEEHPPPHQIMGGGHYDHFDFPRGGHSYIPHEMGGAPYAHQMGGAHHLRHPPLHPRSPPPKYRGRPGAPPSYPPFSALGPAAHLSNAHLAVPVW